MIKLTETKLEKFVALNNFLYACLFCVFPRLNWSTGGDPFYLLWPHVPNARDTFILLDTQVIGGNFMMRDRTANKLIDGPARIAPNRKWFGNTRTIGAEQLDKFRTAVAQQVC